MNLDMEHKPITLMYFKMMAIKQMIYKYMKTLYKVQGKNIRIVIKMKRKN
jgi:hypothetical protein